MRILLLVAAGAMLWGCLALEAMSDPRERTATVLSVSPPDDRGMVTVEVQLDGREEAVEAGTLTTTGTKAVVALGSLRAGDAAVGKRMQVLVGPRSVTFWRWRN
jgi:hypothetical protein